MAKVCVVHDFMGVAKLFKNWGHDVRLDNLNNAELVVFTGGEDISPDLYGEIPLKETFYSDRRDAEEIAFFNQAKKIGLPMVGICRGAQLMCALSGGSIVQHVDNHWGGQHVVQDIFGAEYYVNSLHHQLCMLTNNMTEVSWSRMGGYAYTSDEGMPKMVTLRRETEAWHQDYMFGIQCHPELSNPSGLQQRFFSYIKHYFNISSGKPTFQLKLEEQKVKKSARVTPITAAELPTPIVMDEVSMPPSLGDVNTDSGSGGIRDERVGIGTMQRAYRRLSDVPGTMPSLTNPVLRNPNEILNTVDINGDR